MKSKIIGIICSLLLMSAGLYMLVNMHDSHHLFGPLAPIILGVLSMIFFLVAKPINHKG